MLLLDDNEDLVKIYKERLEKGTSFVVTTATEGARAHRLATNQLFDVIVIDAKLYYRGLEFGGLRLADELRPRYGSNSIIIISRYITAELIHAHGSQYEFIEKSGDAGGVFLSALKAKALELRSRQHVFVAMPFDGRLLKLYSAHIKPAIEEAGFHSVRMDQVSHTRSIHDLMFDLVEKSKLVVLLADGANPNAYYEAGFADALGKEILFVAKSIDVLRFDVRNRPTILYAARPRVVKEELISKIESIRLTTPIRT